MITNVQTTPAQIQDVSLTATIHEALERKSLLPDEHFVDSGYVDADLLASSQHDYGVSLIGPVRPDPSWQAKDPVAYDASRFSIDWSSQTVTCPQGQQSKSWTPSKDPGNNPVITVNFGKKTCKECSARSLCTRSANYPRSLTLHPQEQQKALQQARRRQTTSQWKESYNTRAGIEGTISQAVTAFGLRQNRYRGLAKTRLQHIAIATAINRSASLGLGTRYSSCKNSNFSFCFLKFTGYLAKMQLILSNKLFRQQHQGRNPTYE